MLNSESQLRTASSLMETSSLSLDFKTWLSCIQDPVSMQECCHIKGICALFGMNSNIIFVFHPVHSSYNISISQWPTRPWRLVGFAVGKLGKLQEKLYIYRETKIFWRFTTYPTYPFQRGWSEARICNHFFHGLSWILHHQWAPLLGHEDDGGGQLGRNTAATAGWSTAGLGHPDFFPEIFIWWFFSNRWRLL